MTQKHTGIEEDFERYRGAINKARQQFKRGKTVDWERIKKKSSLREKKVKRRKDMIGTISEVLRNFSKVIDLVNQSGRRCVIEHRGKIVGAIISADELETQEILEDPVVMKRIKRAEEQIKAGTPLLTHEEVFGD